MITLPPPIAAYVAASNALEARRVADCFAPDAIVRDEGSVHHGRAEIEGWAQESGARYRATITPSGIAQAEGRTTLRALVSGDFPGSPIQLGFHFTLVPAGIAALEITP